MGIYLSFTHLNNIWYGSCMASSAKSWDWSYPLYFFISNYASLSYCLCIWLSVSWLYLNCISVLCGLLPPKSPMIVSPQCVTYTGDSPDGIQEILILGATQLYHLNAMVYLLGWMNEAKLNGATRPTFQSISCASAGLHLDQRTGCVSPVTASHPTGDQGENGRVGTPVITPTPTQPNLHLSTLLLQNCPRHVICNFLCILRLLLCRDFGSR